MVVHTVWAKAFYILLYMMPLLRVSVIPVLKKAFCDEICRPTGVLGESGEIHICQITMSLCNKVLAIPRMGKHPCEFPLQCSLDSP
jgi:hypothetical protein